MLSPLLRSVIPVVVAALALAVTAVAQQPPKELHLVEDHWTAWDPPTTFPEGAEVYTIVEGDTLWDLTERFYGNPYLWPQIWERNQYILDAHWIYPGDPLVLGLEVAPADVLGEVDREAEEMEELDEGALAARLRRSPFRPLGSADDIYCSGFIGAKREQFGYRVIGSEYELLGPTLTVAERGKIYAHFGAVDTIKVGLYLGDIVYLDGGRAAGLAPGDIFTAVGVGERITHPWSRRTVGRYYRYFGRVRVLSVQDETAIAEVSQSCHPFSVGTRLKPFEPEPVPSERRTPMRPVNDPPSADSLRDAAVILHAKDGVISLGDDNVVFIDQGEADGVAPGDIYTVYRVGRKKQTPIVLGEIGILSVHKSSSVAKVLRSRYPIYVGDVAQLK